MNNEALLQPSVELAQKLADKLSTQLTKSQSLLVDLVCALEGEEPSVHKMAECIMHYTPHLIEVQQTYKRLKQTLEIVYGIYLDRMDAKNAERVSSLMAQLNPPSDPNMN